jgi:xanthine/uracil/vitamin C permease (AzgA family)
MGDAADTIMYMVVAAIWCECRREKCKGAVPIVSMSPQATAKMLMLFGGHKYSVVGGIYWNSVYMGTPSFFQSVLPDLVLTYLKLQMENSFGIAFWKLADESCG